MQINSRIFPIRRISRLCLRTWVMPATILFLIAFRGPTALYAQTTPPTPIPLAPANTLVAVAGGHGADLWSAAGGEPVATVAPGERLVAGKQSTDGAWVYVTTSAGVSGWAAADTLLIFYRFDLPTEAVTIAPATPTPAPTAQSTVQMTATLEPTATTTEGQGNAVVPAEAAPSLLSAAPIVTGNEPIARVKATTRLNIRGGPGLTYPVVAKAQPDQQLTILGRNGDESWVEVQLPTGGDGSGWVAVEFLAIDGSLTDVAVSTRISAAPPQPSTGAAPVDSPSAVVAAVNTTAATGLTGKLVFQTSDGGPIYLYSLASGQLRQLTSGFDPALSPDGGQVAFTRGGGDNGVYLINSDGSNEHKIFGERELLRSPKWSPDGKWLVFVRGDEFEPCFVFEEDGRCYREPLFPGGNAFDNPPGKNRIAKLARIDTNGENYRDIPVLEQAMAPDWNSNGIVYQSAAGLQITADQSGDPNRKLYFNIQRQYHQDPDWQPGGGRVVFQQRQGSHWQIFAINPDGAGLTALTRPATALVDTMPSNVAPAWSPNGQQIVFLSNRTASNEAGAWRLWVMNADGSNQHPLPVDLPFTYSYVNEQVVDWGR